MPAIIATNDSAKHTTGDTWNVSYVANSLKHLFYTTNKNT